MTLIAAARLVSFDCYGTLIDWERGMRDALAQIPALAAVEVERFLERREAVEMVVEGERYRPYNEVLAISLERTAEEFGVALGQAEGKRFAAGLAGWPPFADAPVFLRRLRASGKPIAILSNVTREGLRHSVRRLDVPFALLVTAADVRSYKPSPPHWLAAQTAQGIGATEQLHVAASLKHDILPATQLGVPCVWVNRRGEALPAGVRPALVVADLKQLSEAWALPPDPRG